MMEVVFYKYTGWLTIVPTICLNRRACDYKFAISVVWLNFSINLLFRRYRGGNDD